MRITNPAVLILSSVSALLLGCAVGYKIAEKRLGDAFDERLQNEIEDVRAFYSTVEKPSPAEMVKALIPDAKIDDLQQYSDALEATTGSLADPNRSREPKVPYHKIRPSNVKVVQGVPAATTEVNRNAFVEAAREEELAILIISDDEFAAGEKDYITSQLTYFEKDDILVDDNDEKIKDKVAHVGENTLTMFGNKSSDSNVVFVRNNTLQLDFEVTRSPSSYAETILGEAYEAPGARPSGRDSRGG